MWLRHKDNLPETSEIVIIWLHYEKRKTTCCENWEDLWKEIKEGKRLFLTAFWYAVERCQLTYLYMLLVITRYGVAWLFTPFGKALDGDVTSTDYFHWTYFHISDNYSFLCTWEIQSLSREIVCFYYIFHNSHWITLGQIQVQWEFFYRNYYR